MPGVKHLNLSSNHLCHVPKWSETEDPCRLVTLKMRQNYIEELIGNRTVFQKEN